MRRWRGVRHAVYDQLLSNRELLRHGLIAARKAAGYSDHVGSVAADVAAHVARAGDVAQAVRYHVEAGHTASRQQAHEVAEAQYQTALELLAHLPDTPRAPGGRDYGSSR